MTFVKWLDTLISEKNIDTDQMLEIEGPSGINYMPLSIVIDAIKSAPKHEQIGIRNMIVRIDFANRSVVDYFKHLARALAV